MFPDFKRIQPRPGQESVWDYPRPPRLEKVCDRLRVAFGGEIIADTDRGFRVLEIDVNGAIGERAAWSYPSPTDAFRALTDFVAFYATRVDACWVGNERVKAQSGDFYGGRITARIVGPFKGPPGTAGW